ncbi:MAG TPA: hypothetical protein VH915_02235 [Pedococcus sp.]|jgi:hypothetical protein
MTLLHLPRRLASLGAGFALLAAVPALCGCGGDPRVEPDAGALELALDRCTLSRASVPAGAHSMAVVGQGRVTISDPRGEVVLTARGGEPDPSRLELAAGTYSIACEPDGGRLAEAELRVEPAD